MGLVVLVGLVLFAYTFSWLCVCWTSEIKDLGPGSPPKHILEKRQGTLRMAMVLGAPQLGTGEPGSARLKFRMELFGPKGWSHGASNQVKRAPTSRVRTQMFHVSSVGPQICPFF